jgi:hypothetical protein
MGGAISLNGDTPLRAHASHPLRTEKSTHRFQGVDESSGISESFARGVPAPRVSFF